MSTRTSTFVILIAPLALAASFASCNGADFGSGSSSSGPANVGNGCDPKTTDCENNAGGTPSTSPGTPTEGDCVDGDKLSMQWTGPVKECLIDKGQTWNFDLKMCAEMHQAKFSCTWENVTKELDQKGLLTDTLKNNSQDPNSKLVSCGQSEDGNRIVVQWVKLPEGGADCTKAFGGSTTTTGCYTSYGSGDTRPPNPSSDDERAKQVYDCMNKL